MVHYDFETIAERKGSLSVKYAPQVIQRICGNPEALPFWVADMDFPVAPAIQAALAAQASHAVLGYPTFSGLRETFIEWTTKRHAWTPPVSRTVVCPGMLSSLALMTELFIPAGKAIIVPMPAYQPFIRLARHASRPVLEWPMRYDGQTHRFSPDLDLLEHLAPDGNAGLLLLCSPHNPTGHVFTHDELHAIATIAAKNNLAVFSDEIHADLAYPGATHVPFDVVAQRCGCTAITCMAPSKTFNIAGEHYSMAVFSRQDQAKAFIRRLESLFIGTSLLSTVTAMAAYRDGYDWLADLTVFLDSQANHIGHVLESRTASLRLVKPEASFIAFIDCQAIMDRVKADALATPQVYDSRQSPDGGLLSRFFGQRAGIAMNDGSWFGQGYGGFVRFNFGTSRHLVDIALERIISAVEHLG